MFVVFAVFAFPTISHAEEKDIFSITGDARVKQFLINDEPDQIQMDYRDNNDTADQELGLSAHARLLKRLQLDLYPYFWHSRENKISRIGLIGELDCDLWDDTLRVGYGHHSWHNVDQDAPDVGGRAQDWFFAEWDFLKYEYREDDETVLRVNLQIKPKIFWNNKEPTAIKELYEKDYHRAFAELDMPMDLTMDCLEIHLTPYWQFSGGLDRYGVRGEVDVKVWKGIWLFADGHYYRSGSQDRLIVGLGLMLRFK